MPSTSISTPRGDEGDHRVHVHWNARRRVQCDRDSCEFGNGPVQSDDLEARTEKGTRERKLGPPRYCWSGTAGEAQLKQFMKYG
jgi:hypothetical protein